MVICFVVILLKKNMQFCSRPAKPTYLTLYDKRDIFIIFILITSSKPYTKKSPSPLFFSLPSKNNLPPLPHRHIHNKSPLIQLPLPPHIRPRNRFRMFYFCDRDGPFVLLLLLLLQGLKFRAGDVVFCF